MDTDRWRNGDRAFWGKGDRPALVCAKIKEL
jgi:hypothetical protein